MHPPSASSSAPRANLRVHPRVSPPSSEPSSGFPSGFPSEPRAHPRAHPRVSPERAPSEPQVYPRVHLRMFSRVSPSVHFPRILEGRGKDRVSAMRQHFGNRRIACLRMYVPARHCAGAGSVDATEIGSAAERVPMIRGICRRMRRWRCARKRRSSMGRGCGKMEISNPQKLVPDFPYSVR